MLGSLQRLAAVAAEKGLVEFVGARRYVGAAAPSRGGAVEVDVGDARRQLARIAAEDRAKENRYTDLLQ